MKLLSWLALSSIFISGIHIETNYGILFLSYALMLITYTATILTTNSFGFRKEYAAFFAILASASYLSFIISSRLYGLDPSRFLSITIKLGMAIFFICFFTTTYNICKKSTKLLFKRYLEVAKIFALIGIAQEAIFIASGYDPLRFISDGSKDYGYYLGIAGLSVEPAFYACALLPSGAYYVSKFFREYKWSINSTISIGAILLSTSSLGYLGLLISAALTILTSIKSKRAWTLIIGIPILIGGIVNVISLDFFKLRLNDTISVLTGSDLSPSNSLNLSTYSLAVNMSISLQSIKDNSGAGAGFGDYSTVFDNYISNYQLPTYRDDFPGRGSATSLFARLTAELGIAAWAIFLLLIYWAWRGIKRHSSPSIAIAYSSTLLIILLRMGEYYVNGVALTLLMIYLIQHESHKKKHNHNSLMKNTEND